MSHAIECSNESTFFSVIKEQWIAEFSPKSVKEVSITKHVISHNQGNKPFINCLNWKKNSGHFLNAWLRHTRIIQWLYVSNSLGHPKLDTSLLTRSWCSWYKTHEVKRRHQLSDVEILKFSWQILLFSYGMCRQVVVDALKNAMLTSVTCWVWWGGSVTYGVGLVKGVLEKCTCMFYYNTLKHAHSNWQTCIYSFFILFL